MTVLFDCDSVLLNWYDGFRSFLGLTAPCFQPPKTRYPRTLYPTSESLGRWLGVTDEDARQLVIQFNSSPAFEHLEPVVGAVEAVARLAQTQKLIVVTACGIDYASARKRNLDRVFGEGTFASIAILELGACKKAALKDFYDQCGPCMWIEDSYRHAVSGAEVGHIPYMIRWPHNADDEANNFDSRIRWVDKFL